MSINIFQFLKQGTTMNRNTLQRNLQLEHQIVPMHTHANQLYFQSGKFSLSDEEQEEDQMGNFSAEQEIEERRKQIERKAALIRKKYQIKVEGNDVPVLIDNFTKLVNKYRLNEGIAKSLAMSGLSKPTHIQMQAIPCLLEERNILATAPTGTGKTLAYLIPILDKLIKKHDEQEKQAKKSIKSTSLKKNGKNKKSQTSAKTPSCLQAIILVPFQQLSTQVKQELTSIHSHLSAADQHKIRFKCISELSTQEKSLLESQNNEQFPYNILIATPLSFIHTLSKSNNLPILLEHLKYFIMDECDKYFEESFLEQIKQILEMVSAAHHPIYGLFSATIQYPVEQLLKSELLDDSVRIEIGGKNKVLSKVQQSIEYCTNQYGKLIELKNMICENKFIPPVLIFVQEKTRAKQLYYELRKIMKNANGGMDLSRRVQVLTGDKKKEERQGILENFQKGVFWVLITTDLVARGVDFQQVNLVINYDFPNSMLTYIHRVGRTGRADRLGTAVTFFTEEDKPLVRSLGNLLQVSGCQVPEWILEMPKIKKQLKKKLEKYPVKRLPVGVAERKDRTWQQEMQKRDKKLLKIRERDQEKEKKKQQAMQDENQQSSEWIQA